MCYPFGILEVDIPGDWQIEVTSEFRDIGEDSFYEFALVDVSERLLPVDYTLGEIASGFAVLRRDRTDFNFEVAESTDVFVEILSGCANVDFAPEVSWELVDRATGQVANFGDCFFASSRTTTLTAGEWTLRAGTDEVPPDGIQNFEIRVSPVSIETVTGTLALNTGNVIELAPFQRGEYTFAIGTDAEYLFALDCDSFNQSVVLLNSAGATVRSFFSCFDIDVDLAPDTYTLRVESDDLSALQFTVGVYEPPAVSGALDYQLDDTVTVQISPRAATDYSFTLGRTSDIYVDVDCDSQTFELSLIHI